MIVLIALIAACLLGVGFVAQQHAAYREPLSEMLRLRLLRDLIHNRLWLLGIGAMIAGQCLGAVALAAAQVSWVEPLLATNLIFALIAAQLVHEEHLGRAEWLGALLVSGGVALFLVLGRPHGGRQPSPDSPQWLAGALVIVLAAALVVAGLRRSLKTKAMLLAAAAGMLYGLQDVLTRSSLLGMPGGLPAVLRSWQPYALLCVAAFGLFLMESAFDAAPLHISLPAITAAEPLTGIALGMAVFAENVRLDAGALAGEVVGIIAMVAGIIILGRSPFLGKPKRETPARPERR